MRRRRTAEPGSPVPDHNHGVYQDKSFTFEMKTPPASYLPEESGKAEQGFDRAWPRRLPVQGDHERRCREIAEAKMNDLNARDIDQAAKIIAGSARSMGLEVSGVTVMAKSWKTCG